jgi:hypothetical protein
LIRRGEELHMVRDIDDVTFWGMNIPKEAEMFVNKTKNENKQQMTENEFKAYCLGIENTISIMKQLLDMGEDGESITFYNPEVEVTEEYRGDDIVKLLNR